MARALIPNSTQVPDIILDHWMSVLSGAEFKVLLYVARRTFGFGKESDSISLNQLAAGICRRDGTRLDSGTGLSRSAVKVACNTLIEKGLLIRTSNTAANGKEAEESTYRLNLYAAHPEPSGGVGQKKAYVGQKKANQGVGQKNAGGGPETGQGVGQKLAPQDTEQETVQETATAGNTLPPHGEGAAAVSLVEQLVKHGVGRSAAEKLAAEKPYVCRRCLEYLPFAKIRTTAGAWLADAIRREYGPPPGYRQAQAGQHRPASAGQGISSSERTLKNQARLQQQLLDLEETNPEAREAFGAFVAADRARTLQFAERTTSRRLDHHLAEFDNPSYRVSLFERWMRGEGRSYLPTHSAARVEQ